MIIHNLLLAKELLEAGELVALPTETVYGLAGNALNRNAIDKIYSVKNRPSHNPLIIHSNSLARFKEWSIHLPENAIKLAEVFSPGPITFVVKSSPKIPDLVTAGHPSVAIRIPNHSLALQLLSILDFPVAAPSANLSGSVSPTTALHVEQQLGNLIGGVLDGGNCSVGLESTIVSFLNPKPQLLRLGGLAVESIEQVLGESLDQTNLLNNENPLAPGMLSKHYAPQTKLRLGQPEDYLKICDYTQMAFIAFAEPNPHIPINQQFVLSPNKDTELAAQKLYATLREADALNLKLIVAEVFPEEKLGSTLNDRLKRASKN